MTEYDEKTYRRAVSPEEVEHRAARRTYRRRISGGEAKWSLSSMRWVCAKCGTDLSDAAIGVRLGLSRCPVCCPPTGGAK
jgi:rubrerythrin